jgi:hypothetical protein
MCTNPALACDDFALTVASIPSVTAFNVVIQVFWTNPAAEFDVYVNDLNGNPIVFEADSINPQVAIFRARAGTNSYTVRVVPSVATGDSYTATIGLEPVPAIVPQATGLPPRFQDYQTPLALGGGFGEPSIGANLKTGHVLMTATTGLNPPTIRTTFDDCPSPANVTWENVGAPLTSQATLDAILFLDQRTCRTFVSQLVAATSLMEFTDDDGNTYTPSNGAGIGAGPDHQTIASGPFAPPLMPVTSYPDIVYYCSQASADASCATSLDGGVNFGPAVAIYNQTICGGLHGHIKVGPDGSAYVPNTHCQGSDGRVAPAVIASDDNGITWTVRIVEGSRADGSSFLALPGEPVVDPSLGIARDGTLYFGYQAGDSTAHIAVSRDKGKNWQNDQDVGAALGILNTTFPEVTAGDGNRAAFAFLATTTAGNYQDQPTFTNLDAIWHLYIATTYDGGKSYFTVDATPDDPVQRGSICNSGTVICSHTPNDRNLLDFMDTTIDAKGRILVAYPDGCITDACIHGSSGSSNDYGAQGSVARQSGGKTLLAAFDPQEPAVPSAPRVDSIVHDSSGVHITWSRPDNGGATIIGYRIYRRTATGTYSPLVTVPDTAIYSGLTLNYQISYTDTTVAPNTTYFYKITAFNGQGEGPSCNE